MWKTSWQHGLLHPACASVGNVGITRVLWSTMLTAAVAAPPVPLPEDVSQSSSIIPTAN